MLSHRINSSYITSILERDLANIYNSQLLIARKNIYIKGRQLKTVKRRGALIGRHSGALLDSLENPTYNISANAQHFNVTAFIVPHIRFLDMKHLGNRQIYNRQVWGILYNNSLRDIRYSVGNDIYNKLSETLRQALNS